MRHVLILAGAGILSASIWAGVAEDAARIDPNAAPIEVDRGAAGLSRWLAAIRTRASILMVTAHPDDEDGGMLAAVITESIVSFRASLHTQVVTSWRRRGDRAKPEWLAPSSSSVRRTPNRPHALKNA
jgi:hypothetical protein